MPSQRNNSIAGNISIRAVNNSNSKVSSPFAINPGGPGRVESDLPMKTKTHFAFRVDVWDDAGNSVVEHVAGVDDFVRCAVEKGLTYAPTAASGRAFVLALFTRRFGIDDQ